MECIQVLWVKTARKIIQTWAKKEDVDDTATPVGLTHSKLLIRNFLVGKLTSGDATKILLEFVFLSGGVPLLT